MARLVTFNVMGWWSVNILGGDEPLDALDRIEEVLGVEFEDGSSGCVWAKRETFKAAFETHRAQLFNDAEGAIIATQVLGVVALAAGVTLLETERAAIILAAHADSSIRFYDAESREEELDAFAKRVASHNGEIVPVNQAGLSLFGSLNQ